MNAQTHTTAATSSATPNGHQATGSVNVPGGLPLTRRQALRTLAAGSAAGALAAGAVVAVTPAPALAATPIEGMTARLRAMFDRVPPAGETDEQGDAHSKAFAALQERVIRAEPQTPRDVALQFMADTHWGASDMSDEFSDRLAAMADMGSVSADASKVAPDGTPRAGSMAELVERNRVYLAAYAAADFEAGGREAEEAFLAKADTEAGDILYQNPPPVRDHADLMAALAHVTDDTDFIGEGHERILRQALAYLEGGAA